MNILQLIHAQLANTVWLFFLIIGIWGIFRAARGLGVDGNYLGATAVGQLLFVVQIVLGVILYLGGSRPADNFMHWLYGAFSLVFVPFVYLVWMRGDDSNQSQWVLGFTTLFMFGIALRSITTGAG